MSGSDSMNRLCERIVAVSRIGRISVIVMKEIDNLSNILMGDCHNVRLGCNYPPRRNLLLMP